MKCRHRRRMTKSMDMWTSHRRIKEFMRASCLSLDKPSSLFLQFNVIPAPLCSFHLAGANTAMAIHSMDLARCWPTPSIPARGAAAMPTSMRRRPGTSTAGPTIAAVSSSVHQLSCTWRPVEWRELIALDCNNGVPRRGTVWSAVFFGCAAGILGEKSGFEFYLFIYGVSYFK